MQFARRIIQEHIIINRQWWCSKVGTASTKLFCCEQYKMYLETERKKRVASSRTHLQSVFFVRTPYSSFDVLQRKKKMYNQQQRVRGKKPVPSERERKKSAHSDPSATATNRAEHHREKKENKVVHEI